MERCECVDSQGHSHPKIDDSPCCRITIRGFTEIMPSTDPNLPPIALGIVIKEVILCEKRQSDNCREYTCERFRVPNSVHEVVDENGEVTGTAESVICRCL